MKKLSVSLTAIVLSAFLNSCGVGHAFVFNHNHNSTQVQLGSNNFKVTNKVSGSAEVSYVLVFGGMNKKQLYNNAYAKMVDAADLSSGSKTLANVVTEEHVGGVFP